MNDDSTGTRSDDKFASLYNITRQTFTEAFSEENVARLAQLKHEEPERYQDLRQRWKSEKFPSMGELTKVVDTALAQAKKRAKLRAEQPEVHSDRTVLQVGDPRS